MKATNNLNFYILKLLTVVYLGIGLSSTYGNTIEGFCYPENAAQIYNGMFLSNSHISLKDYIEDPKYAQIPLSAKRSPINQKIPTFWYKINFKNSTGNYIDNTDTTYGPPTKVFRTGVTLNFIQEKHYPKWSFEFDPRKSLGFVIFTDANEHSINFNAVCNESPRGKELEEFKFKPTDTFALPVRVKNDNSFFVYQLNKLPTQGGTCYNKKNYPDFWLHWKYMNGKTTITMRDKNNVILDTESGITKEQSWQADDFNYYPGYRIPPDLVYTGQAEFLNGFIHKLMFADGELYLSDEQGFLDQHNNLFGKDSKKNPIGLAFLNYPTKEKLYDVIDLDTLRKTLTTTWTLNYNNKDYDLTCTPDIEIPWQGASKIPRTDKTTIQDDWNIPPVTHKQRKIPSQEEAKTQ